MEPALAQTAEMEPALAAQTTVMEPALAQTAGMEPALAQTAGMEPALAQTAESQQMEPAVVQPDFAYVQISDSQQLGLAPIEIVEIIDGTQLDVANFQVIEPVPLEDNIETVAVPSRKRRNVADPESWVRNRNKQSRIDGLAYQNPGRKGKDARSMGTACNSDYCKTSHLRNCDSITDKERCEIFTKFWIELNTWNERQAFVTGLVKRTPIKQKTNAKTRRHCTYAYYLSSSESTYQVCQKMFLATFGIPQRTLANWLNSTDCDNSTGNITSDSRAALTKPATIDANFLSSFLNSLATVPSHYCRSQYADTKFLEPDTTITAIYIEYTSKAKESNRAILSYPLFLKAFRDGNFSIFIPRKDQCDVCISGKFGGISAESLAAHRQLKDEAQTCKRNDKTTAKSDATVSCWTMDLQAVLLCPKTKASCMYYKTKLQVHNFTLFNLRTHEGYCYVWDECNGDVSSNMFAWLQYTHFKRYIQEHPDVKILIIWSDGCGYQNRNSTVANAYLHLAKEHSITILQKYLVAGHTQMECDSVHSVIERKIRGPVYSPRDYTIVMQAAWNEPTPYNVTQIHYDSIKDGFQDTYVTTIRPGKKAGDPTVHQLRVLKYTAEGIEYKLSFDDEYMPLSRRHRLPSSPVLTQRYNAKLPISKRKYDDLHDLKHVIPADVHPFFDSLPHE